MDDFNEAITVSGGDGLQLIAQTGNGFTSGCLCYVSRIRLNSSSHVSRSGLGRLCVLRRTPHLLFSPARCHDRRQVIKHFNLQMILPSRTPK